MISGSVSHYRIISRIGSGGMGEVYKAEDTRLHRIVALKFLSNELTREEESRQRFIREAEAASSLQHHNVCTIHDIDETEDGQIFISMDCYEGKTLKEKIAEHPLKLNEAVNIAIQIAEGLQSAHLHQIIHRDIKPANIFITKEGEVKILDFGLARLTGKSMITKMGSTVGTLSYMSPEQISGEKVDSRTDIWSLGVVIYEMISGLPPFRGEYEQAILYSVTSGEPDPITNLRTGIPLELERIVTKTMAKKPAERYQHIDELIVDLKNLVKVYDSKTSGGTKTIIIQKETFFKKFRRYLIPAFVIIIIMVTLFFLKPILLGDSHASEPMPIAVITFENQTGDHSFDYLQKAIPNLLITNLEQSNFFRVTTWERMQDLLDQMGKPDTKVIDKNLGFDICRKEGVDVIVIGSYIKAGNIFATDVKVLDVATKKIIKSVSVKGEGISSILESQIDDLSKKISQGIGVSYSKIAAAKMKVIDVTTNSMEAYNYYLNGRDNDDKFYYEEAAEEFEKAIEIDSSFAIAYLGLAQSYSSLGEAKKRNEALEKAHQFSLNATEKEKLMIDEYYAWKIERNRGKQLRLLKELAVKYPKEKIVYYNLGVYFQQFNMNNEAIDALNKALTLDPDYGVALNTIAYAYSGLGDYGKAIEYLKKYSRLNPKDANPFDSMADYYWRIGDLDLAIKYYLKAIDVKSDFSDSMLKLCYIYAMKENYHATEKWKNRAIATPTSTGNIARLYWINAFYDSWYGKINLAIKNLHKAKELSKTVNNKFIEAGSNWLEAYILYDIGKLELCGKYYLRFLDIIRKYYPAYISEFTVSYKFLSALINIKQGLVDSAIAKRNEINSLMQNITGDKNRLEYKYDYLNAEILLAENLPVKAIKTFKDGARQTIPIIAYADILIYNTPFMQNGLARAYLKAGQIDNAISEYERSITYNRQGEDRHLIHPRYHYLLAVLYEEKGFTEKAKSQYKKFLELWKDADKNLPELIDAKTRLNRLSVNP